MGSKGIKRRYRKATIFVTALSLVVSALLFAGSVRSGYPSISSRESLPSEPVAQKPYIPQHIYAVPASNEVLSQQDSLKLIWPVERGLGKITQCVSAAHNGIDIAHPGYPDVIAAHRGKVTFAGCEPRNCPPDGEEQGGEGLARSVIIEHESGLSTVYGHLNEVYVKTGFFVEAGTSIGQMGRTGKTNGGVHLHFMLAEWGKNKVYNPAKFMDPIECPDGD
ncbi:MAG: M23 family metallopeptidase [Candidatus Dojkabacteria bacterium]|nr:MAG: M23 family metallopeptidase [Candidatus Dojkabacteria bacterium]